MATGLISTATPTPTPAPLIKSRTGESFSEQEVKDWFAFNKPSDNQVADRASQLGLNQQQITTAFNVAGRDKPETTFDAVGSWVDDTSHGYKWDEQGSLTKLQRQAPATQSFTPQLNRQIDAGNETIEGRLGGILARDDAGNYTNQTVRQAVERAQQQFAKRGLVNSSMAAQAGQEAAIAKAIEIAGPDAERYFQQGRANQDASNVFARDQVQQGYTQANDRARFAQESGLQTQRLGSDAALQAERLKQDATNQQLDRDFRERTLANEQAFNLRANYVTAQDRVSQSYQRMVDTINTSNMKPEDKTEAIANAAQIRDSEAAYINGLFAKQPGWQSDWLALSVQAGGANIDALTDVNALSTIANDPAQPADMRAKASARLAYLQANPPEPTPSPTPAPGLVETGYGA